MVLCIWQSLSECNALRIGQRMSHSESLPWQAESVSEVFLGVPSIVGMLLYRFIVARGSCRPSGFSWKIFLICLVGTIPTRMRGKFLSEKTSRPTGDSKRNGATSTHLFFPSLLHLRACLAITIASISDFIHDCIMECQARWVGQTSTEHANREI